MEQFALSEYSLMQTTHEYPDPDYAAYVTQYPWREDDGYLPLALHGLPSESLEEISRPGNHGDPWSVRHIRGEVVDSDAQGLATEVAWDSDYQMSEACAT